MKGRRGVESRCCAYAMGPIMTAHEARKSAEPRDHLWSQGRLVSIRPSKNSNPCRFLQQMKSLIPVTFGEDVYQDSSRYRLRSPELVHLQGGYLQQTLLLKRSRVSGNMADPHRVLEDLDGEGEKDKLTIWQTSWVVPSLLAIMQSRGQNMQVHRGCSH